MKLKSERIVSASREAQQDLCECLADALRAGIISFRFSFVHEGDTINHLSIHVFQNHIWRCLDVRIPLDVVISLWKRLKTGSSAEVKGLWDCDCIDHPSQTDFELRFHPAAVSRASAGNIDSFLNRCLFHNPN